MNKRSLSPLIATFILISVTVAVGAMIVAWGRGYVQKQMECLKLGASLSLLSKNFVGNPWTINLRLYNTGETSLKKEELIFKVYTVEGTWEDCTTTGACYFSGFDVVNQGGFADIVINIDSTSAIYNKMISRIELHHRSCNQLITSIFI